MTKQLNILGCVPDLLNVLIELANASGNFQSFCVLQNIPVAIGNSYKPIPGAELTKFDCFDDHWPEQLADVFALSVVGCHSKPLVVDWFQQRINCKREQFVNFVHPSSVVAPSATITNGLQLEALSIIASCTEIGFAVNIKRGTSIGHHCKLDDYVTVNPGVTMSSQVKVGTQTMIGAGTVIREGISIGRNCVIGMGSVVLKDLPDDVVAYGNPCVVIKDNKS
ncbi:MAG TPA: acetyltransferase [Lacibacter sp.]|nr:acetyltransferase [Lacibacter sp.]